MQFTIALTSAILAFASGIAAAPAGAPVSQVTLTIFNDISGANAAATVPVDNIPRDLWSLFGNSAINGKDGFVGTSAQLTKFTDTTKCTLTNQYWPAYNRVLDGRAQNFVDLDGDKTQPIPIWLGGFTFQCQQA
ncbi:hypothetical protein ACN47E_000578 [Coniothyrium glycines]